jgi:hypothetical protein
MNNLSNVDASRQPPHRAHRAPAIATSACKAKIYHRKRRSERLVYEEVAYLSDELELVELRYEALHARMVLEELFSEGFLP